MVYKRYIYRNGKRFGPYYYHTHRDEEGKTYSRYIPHHEVDKEPRAVTGINKGNRHLLLIVLSFAIIGIVLAILILNYQLKTEGEFNFKSIGQGIYSAITGFTAEELPPTEEPVSEPEITDETSGEESVAEDTIVEETPEESIEEEPILGFEESNETPESLEETEIVNETLTEIQNETTSNETVLGPEKPIEDVIPSEGGSILGNESTNFTISNETITNITNETLIEGNISITQQASTKQFDAVLGKPVKWEKRIKVDIEGSDKIDSVTLEIPKPAGNIKAKKIKGDVEEEVNFFVEGDDKIEEVESNIKETEETDKNVLDAAFNFFLSIIRFTARVIEMPQFDEVTVEVTGEILDNEEILIEYETPAPYAIESDVENGKLVKIIGPETIHYENVLAFTQLNESLNVKSPGSVTIFWREQNTFVSPQSVLDEDSNGIYDYIEWVVPQLSNQTFEIIVIKKAEHLDSNKIFISNIYNEVKELDGVWSETIPNGDYVRVTFEINLTNENDITIYPRTVNGTPRIEIYEVGSDSLIAEFTSIVDNEYNKVFLTNLISESQDVFDLLILNGDVQFEHIVDPTAGPNASAFDTILRPQSCAGNDAGVSDSFPDSCDGTYPSGSCGAGADLVSCNDSINETMTASAAVELDWGGVHLNYSNSSITNCDSITEVFVCYEWWITNGGAQNCRVTVSNGTTEYNANTTCPGSTADPGVICQNVTSNLNWVCSSFFNTTQESYTESEFQKSSGLATRTGHWDVLYFNITYTETSGNTAPQWSQNSTNSTLAGRSVYHSVYWTDDSALSGYIFSFDNGTGTLANDSFVTFSGTQNWSNVTKVVNRTIGSVIRWRVYANDSANTWNVTDTFAYNTTNNPPTQSNPIINFYPTALTSQNIICTNQSTSDFDGHNVTNIYNWLIDGVSYMLVNLPFDTNTTTNNSVVKDYSGKGANGTITDGDLNWTPMGKLGGAYDFPAQDYYINVSKNSISFGTNFTITFWTRDHGGFEGYFAKGNFSQGIVVESITGASTLYTYLDGFSLIVPLIPTSWTMYTLTCKPSNCSVYINSTLTNSTTNTPSVSNLSLFDFYIGRAVTRYAVGIMDEFRVYNMTLTPQQINQIYLEGINNFTNSTIVSQETTTGQNWTCQVTPNDVYGDGDMKQNSTTIIASAPPNVTLVSPSNTTTVYDGATFNCSVTDDVGLTNISLYGNWSGGWHLNQTVNITGTSNSTVFNVVLDNGKFIWNCEAYDNHSLSDWGDSNFTVTNDKCENTQISSSTTLTSNVCEYYNITANNVVFDCNNYKIIGPSNLTDNWTMTVDNKTNVTIKNCVFENWRNVINFTATNNSFITNTSIFNTTDKSSGDVQAVGIYFSSSFNNTIDANITTVYANSSSTTSCFTGKSRAFWFVDSENNTIKHSTVRDAHGEQQGAPGETCDPNIRVLLGYFFYLDNSPNTTIYNATGRDSRFGLLASSSEFVNLTGNNFSDFDSTGFNFNPSSFNATIFRNNFQEGTLLLQIASSNNPNITGNNFSYAEIAIFLPTGTGGVIEYNRVEHMSFSDTSTGAIEASSSSFGSLKGNTLFNITVGSPTSAAVFVGRTITAENNNITNATHAYAFGDNADNSRIVNDVLTNIQGNVSYLPTGTLNISFVNVTFNKSAIYVVGTATFFNYYYLQVNVTNQNLAAVDAANVNITKNATGGPTPLETTTNASGLTVRFEIQEFNQTSSLLTNHTPHNISTTKTGYSYNTTNVTLTQSRFIHLIISTPTIDAYVPTTDNFSIVENNNQTFSIVYSNTTPVTTKWFVNGSQQTGSTNNSQFIWVGNFSQEGIYQIKVNISNEVGEDEQIWYMTVNNTPARINLSLVYPTGNINASQNSFFNVTLNVTCGSGRPDCGAINVSLISNVSNNTLVNTTAGATPFYTNSSTNPQTTTSLNSSQSQIITFWVNATGVVGTNHTFVAYANMTSNQTISNITNTWNVTIAEPAFEVAIELSAKLTQQINWTLATLPANNISADGNNGTGITEYWVNISVVGGTADLYMRANANLSTPGGDILGLGNETYSYNSTNSTVSSDIKTSLTTNYSEHKIGSALSGSAVIYLKFFLSAPAAQPAGTYNNTLLFKAVQTGQTP